MSLHVFFTCSILFYVQVIRLSIHLKVSCDFCAQHHRHIGQSTRYVHWNSIIRVHRAKIHWWPSHSPNILNKRPRRCWICCLQPSSSFASPFFVTARRCILCRLMFFFLLSSDLHVFCMIFEVLFRRKNSCNVLLDRFTIGSNYFFSR